MFAIKRAIFVELKLSLNIAAVFISCIIPSFTFRTLKGDDFNNLLTFLSHFVNSLYNYTKSLSQAFRRNRTADLNLTEVALCRLSYKGIKSL